MSLFKSVRGASLACDHACGLLAAVVLLAGCGSNAACRPVGMAAATKPFPGEFFFNGARSGSHYAIGMRGRSQPILEGTPGSWDADGAKDPYIVGHRLFYSGYAKQGGRTLWGVGVAIEHAGRWTKQKKPVVGPYDPHGAHPFPVVVVDDRHWVLFYASSRGIFARSSADGTHWGQPRIVLPARGALITPGDVRRRGADWLLLYGRLPKRQSEHWRMRVAVAKRLQGPYRDGWALKTAGRVRLFIKATSDGWRVNRMGGIPVDSASLTPEFVLRRHGKTYLTAAAFQQVPGCLVEMGLVGEMRNFRSVRWLASASPLVPIGSSGWDSNSAENVVQRRAR
jgi:hypothetical protein